MSTGVMATEACWEWRVHRQLASAVVTARAPARPAPVPLCQHSMVTPVSVLL